MPATRTIRKAYDLQGGGRMLELSTNPMDLLIELLSDQEGVPYEYTPIDPEPKETDEETA